MAAVSQDDHTTRPNPDAGRPRSDARPIRQKAPKPAPEDVRIPRQMLEVCRSASLLLGGPNIRRLGVTSALREEGRTSIALAMAVVQREDYGRRVALVDMDLENPVLARRYGLEPWPGLAELTRREASIEDVLQPLSDGVMVVPSGVLAASAARTMTDIVKSDVLSELERHVDVVVVDMPPLLGGGPGSSASRAFREILLVIRAGVTPVARIKEATDDLQVVPHVLLNDIHTSLPRWLRRLSGR
jgi:Mrp family chromosome partitioning ATPase